MNDIDFDIDKLSTALGSGIIEFPQGLTRIERRAYVLGKLKAIRVEKLMQSLRESIEKGTLVQLSTRK